MLQEKDVITAWYYANEKAEYYRNKYKRARKNFDIYYAKYKLYRAFEERAYALLMAIRCKRNLYGRPSNFTLLKSDEYLKREKARIEKGRHRFLTLHTYETWFMQTGLHCDYGTYTCVSCGRKFHHSPSRVWKAAKIIHECACGYCTNDIIEADYGKRPYF